MRTVGHVIIGLRPYWEFCWQAPRVFSLVQLIEIRKCVPYDTLPSDSAHPGSFVGKLAKSTSNSVTRRR